MEVICGELINELRKMKVCDDLAAQGGDLNVLGLSSRRPEDFPRSYVRIWLSNIP
jgi:hypothetical protein